MLPTLEVFFPFGFVLVVHPAEALATAFFSGCRSGSCKTGLRTLVHVKWPMPCSRYNFYHIFNYLYCRFYRSLPPTAAKLYQRCVVNSLINFFLTMGKMVGGRRFSCELKKYFNEISDTYPRVRQTPGEKP